MYVFLPLVSSTCILITYCYECHLKTIYIHTYWYIELKAPLGTLWDHAQGNITIVFRLVYTHENYLVQKM